MIAFLILSPFVIGILAAWLVSRFPNRAGVIAAWPALLAVVLGSRLLRAVPGEGELVELPWAPSLGLSLSFNLDGLGLLFATLITGTGALVVLYASRYLDDHPQTSRFYASLFAFMGAMLGVVLSDNVLTLFVFWELTGFTSFLLIGFDHERAAARSAALQALIVTAPAAWHCWPLACCSSTSRARRVCRRWPRPGRRSWRARLRSDRGPGPPRRVHEIRPGAVPLLAAECDGGAHAGERLSPLRHDGEGGRVPHRADDPVLGSTPLWTMAVTVAGAATMVVGAWRAVQETDLKRILAYSTLSALGVLTMLLGVGTREAIVAALVYLIAHAATRARCSWWRASSTTRWARATFLRLRVCAERCRSQRSPAAPPRSRWPACR